MYSCIITRKGSSKGAEVMNEEYGYIRVSSRDQNEQRQLVTMLNLGLKEKNIYIDKQSGKDFERIEYKNLMKKLKPGDTVYVSDISRFGRNYSEIMEQWRIITKKKAADIVVLDMPLLDTRYAKDLLGTFLSDLVLQVLSFVAENERKNIKKIQAEGIAVAKANGVRFGRPRRMELSDFKTRYAALSQQGLSNTEIRQYIDFPRSTFYRYLKMI